MQHRPQGFSKLNSTSSPIAAAEFKNLFKRHPITIEKFQVTENIPQHRIPYAQDFSDNLTAHVLFTPYTASQKLPESFKPPVPMQQVLLWMRSLIYLKALDKNSQRSDQTELG